MKPLLIFLCVLASVLVFTYQVAQNNQPAKFEWKLEEDSNLEPACLVVERMGEKIMAIHVDIQACKEQK